MALQMFNGLRPAQSQAAEAFKPQTQSQPEAEKPNNESEEESELELVPAPDNSVTYSSHPMQNLHLHRFIFEKAQILVAEKDVDEFEALVASQPPQIRNMIHRIDVTRANQLVQQHRSGRMTAGVDTSANTLEPAPSLNRGV